MSLTKVSFSMVSGAWFNVLDFGAVGDGTTNDTAAIQACVDAAVAANGGAVFLPTGTYKITSAISVISPKISIYGEGAEATVIQCLSCNGINIVSPSTDRNTQFFEDFSLIGMTGSTANFSAIESILPPGGISGVDQRDGLHFNRIKFFDWNKAFVISDTWESTIQLCKFQKVTNPIQFGTYSMVWRVINNFMVYEDGDSHGGTADAYAINFTGAVAEGAVIQNNQFFGFDRGINSSSTTNNVFLNVISSDFSCVEYCIYVETVQLLFRCEGNYFETRATNGVGVFIAPQNSEISSQNVIHSNNFINNNAANTNTIGIVTGAAATTFAWRNDIQFNLFTGFTGFDIALLGSPGKTNLANNRCESTGTTASIKIGSVTGGPVTVAQNWCKKNILVDDSANLTAGTLLLNQNTENDTYQAWRQTAAPTTGTWRRGDIVYNSTPSSAGYIGFVCTVAGAGTLVVAGVAIAGTAGEFTCTASTLVVGQQLVISGTLGGTGTITGYSNPTTYLISVTNGTTTFTLTTLAGAAIVTTIGTPTGLTYTLAVPIWKSFGLIV